MAIRSPRIVRNAIAGLIGVAAILVVAPLFMPWQSIEARLAATVDRAIGRQIYVDGDLRLQLLPRPALVARNVRLGNPDSHTVSDTMVHARRLSLEVDVFSLLVGRLKFQRAVIVDPTIELLRFADNTTNWSFVGAVDTATTGNLGSSDRPDLNLRIGELVLRNGHIDFHNIRNGRDLQLTEVELVVQAVSLDGPFRVDGRVTNGSQRIDVRAAIDKLVEDRAIPLLASAASENVGMTFDGVLSGYPQQPVLSGRFTLSTYELSVAQNGADTAVTQAAGKPIVIEAFANLSGESLALEQLAMDLGSQVSRGGLRVDFTDAGARGRLTIDRLDIDLLRQEFLFAAGRAEPSSELAKNLMPLALSINIGQTILSGETSGPLENIVVGELTNGAAGTATSGTSDAAALAIELILIQLVGAASQILVGVDE